MIHFYYIVHIFCVGLTKLVMYKSIKSLSCFICIKLPCYVIFLWLQVVLLGSAPDPRIQNDFVNLANQLHSSHGDRARLVLTYDEPLSHLVGFH